MIGIGLTPEAIENNPVAYDLALEMTWREVNQKNFFHFYQLFLSFIYLLLFFLKRKLSIWEIGFLNMLLEDMDFMILKLMRHGKYYYQQFILAMFTHKKELQAVWLLLDLI